MAAVDERKIDSWKATVPVVGEEFRAGLREMGDQVLHAEAAKVRRHPLGVVPLSGSAYGAEPRAPESQPGLTDLPIEHALSSAELSLGRLNGYIAG
jgi:hypothetical protein